MAKYRIYESTLLEMAKEIKKKAKKTPDWEGSLLDKDREGKIVLTRDKPWQGDFFYHEAVWEIEVLDKQEEV